MARAVVLPSGRPLAPSSPRRGKPPRGSVGAAPERSPDDVRRRQLWAEWRATAILSTLLLTILVYSGVTTRFDNALYDVSLRLKPERPRPDIVIVAIDPKSLAQGDEWPWRRSVVAKLIGDINKDGPIALACHFLFMLPSPDDQAVHDSVRLARTYLGLPQQEATGGRRPGPLRPVPEIASAAAGLGAGDSQPDRDGIVRRASLSEVSNDGIAPRMVLQMARLDGRRPGFLASLLRGNEMLIPFAGPPGTFKTVSAISVLNGQIDPRYFKNKFVLLGATAPEILDNYPTPRSGAAGMPSVEIDANILNSLLSNIIIVSTSKTATLVISICYLWFILFSFVRLGPRDNLRVAAATSGFVSVSAVLILVVFGLWIPPASFLATMALVIPYWGWRRLNAASAYFADELRTLEFSVGAGVLSHPRLPRAREGDFVLQQMFLLEETKRRISDLQRFVADILANFPDPVLVVDREGCILTGNQAAAEFAHGIGASAADRAPIEPILSKIAASSGDRRPIWPPPERDTLAGSAAAARPITGLGPAGRSYELRYTETRDASDEPTGWIVHLADITALVSAMRQREEALQLLSHDMRSPLSAILASLAHPDFKDAPPGLRKRIEGQAGRTLGLADAFVRLAKAESADYRLEAIDLAHILRDAADAVWSLAEAAGVTIDLELEEVEYVVLADRGLVTRAFVNLLDNAVKFSPPGARVTCVLRPAEIDRRRAVACDIIDQAGGISQSQLASLFRRFAQSRDAVNGSQGIGLGLALVHTVVTRHGGVITCESTEGHGTVFTIKLPVHAESEARAVALTEA